MAAFAPPAAFSEPERKVLLCVLDALWADLGEEGARQLAAAHRRRDASEEELVAYARRPASACGDVIGALEVKVGSSPAGDIAELHALLRALASRAGCLALTGRRGPIYRLQTPAIEGILKSWMSSPVGKFREIGKAFKLLVGVVAMGAQPGQEGVNWRAIGYEAPDVVALRAAAQSPGSLDLAACRVPSLEAAPQRTLAGAGGAAPPDELVCDCVIVGSGPGGAVVAAELAEAGFRVALLEYGRWESADERECSELHAFRHMYQEAGNFFTKDRNLTILAGSALGGGAAVNWSCCLPPTQQVRDEWARDFGVDWAAGPEMADSVERARERLSMSKEGVELNAANAVLLRGCERLGYQAEVAAQQGRAPSRPDHGGWCSAGWKEGARQGMHGSALADAARTGNLLLLDGCSAQEVLRDHAGRACAVRGTLRRGGGSREVLVRGRGVVVAGGALQTPLLLRRSGLKNPHIGKHLHLHPAMTIFGRFRDPVEFVKGAPMTTVSRVVEDQDGRGYGAKIWVPNFHPITWAALLPWQGSREYKSAFAGFSHAAPLISLVRDQSEGRVRAGSDGRPRVSYTMGQTDKAHLLKAVEHSARILVAAGAEEVHSAHNGVEPLVADAAAPGGAAIGQPELEAWLGRIRAAGLPELGVALGSAHQMGTCRMAGRPELGAVRPSGEAWEVPGLFVADTSTFPTASGVNPMWTCAAIAHRVSQSVKQHLDATPAVADPRPPQRAWRAACASARAASPRAAQAQAGERAPAKEAVADTMSTASTEASSGESVA